MAHSYGSEFDLTSGLRDKIGHLENKIDELDAQNKRLLDENRVYKEAFKKNERFRDKKESGRVHT